MTPPSLRVFTFGPNDELCRRNCRLPALARRAENFLRVASTCLCQELPLRTAQLINYRGASRGASARASGRAPSTVNMQFRALWARAGCIHSRRSGRSHRVLTSDESERACARGTWRDRVGWRRSALSLSSSLAAFYDGGPVTRRRERRGRTAVRSHLRG